MSLFDVRLHFDAQSIRTTLDRSEYEKLTKAALAGKKGWSSFTGPGDTPLLINLERLVAIEVVAKQKPSDGRRPGITLKEIAAACGVSYRVIHHRAEKLGEGALEKLSERRLASSDRNFDLLAVPEHAREAIRTVENERAKQDSDQDE